MTESSLATTSPETHADVVDIQPVGVPPLPKHNRVPLDTVDDLLDMLAAVPAPAAPPTSSADDDETYDANESANPTAASTPSVDVMAAMPVDVATDEPSGDHFLNWLRSGIRSRKIIINDARALVHTVAGTVYLVSPGIFQRYAQEHPEITRISQQAGVPEWRWAQQCFERMKAHQKRANGLNIWTCEVTGQRKSRRLHGYLLADADRVFKERPMNNPYLKLIDQE
jgi:hypothetical protein